jgi:response regulator of citrate/malate metabolism
MDDEVTIEEIITLLQGIDDKLDRLINMAPSCSENRIPAGLDVMTLLSLPDHLRTTATALFELGPSTAEELARKTSKKRAVESSYLNQLVRMGHVHKFRDGKKVIFQIQNSS